MNKLSGFQRRSIMHAVREGMPIAAAKVQALLDHIEVLESELKPQATWRLTKRDRADIVRRKANGECAMTIAVDYGITRNYVYKLAKLTGEIE